MLRILRAPRRTPQADALERLATQMRQWNVPDWHWTLGPDRWAHVVWRFRGVLYGLSSRATPSAPAGTALLQCARLIQRLAVDAKHRGVPWTVLAPHWCGDDPASAEVTPPAGFPPVPACFRLLGFTEIPATRRAVKDRYRALAKTTHPDAGGDLAAFRALTEAAAAADAWMAAHALPTA